VLVSALLLQELLMELRAIRIGISMLIDTDLNPPSLTSETIGN